jgi:hypothetical protein
MTNNLCLIKYAFCIILGFSLALIFTYRSTPVPHAQPTEKPDDYPRLVLEPVDLNRRYSGEEVESMRQFFMDYLDKYQTSIESRLDNLRSKINHLREKHDQFRDDIVNQKKKCERVERLIEYMISNNSKNAQVELNYFVRGLMLKHSDSIKSSTVELVRIDSSPTIVNTFN